MAGRKDAENECGEGERRRQIGHEPTDRPRPRTERAASAAAHGLKQRAAWREITPDGMKKRNRPESSRREERN